MKCRDLWKFASRVLLWSLWPERNRRLLKISPLILFILFVWQMVKIYSTYSFIAVFPDLVGVACSLFLIFSGFFVRCLKQCSDSGWSIFKAKVSVVMVQPGYSFPCNIWFERNQREGEEEEKIETKISLDLSILKKRNKQSSNVE